MAASLLRILAGLLVAIPLVAAVSFVLVHVPQFISLAVGVAGIALLMMGETFRSKPAAALAGVLATGGVFAWALVAARLV